MTGDGRAVASDAPINYALRPMRRPLRAVLLFATLPLLPACSAWLFSGEHWIDRSQPVALVETTGGVELGATTEFGVLTLGRTATEGACRVHYFLGPTPLIDDGQIVATGSVFHRADIDLKTMLLPCMDRDPTPEDRLVAMWMPDPRSTTSVSVQLSTDSDASGDVLVGDGLNLPAGATVLRVVDDGYEFVGLIAGRATLQGRSYYVFAGMDRVREMLAVPQEYPARTEPKFRPDDIVVDKPVKR